MRKGPDKDNGSMVRRVLVATDRSETAEVAVRFAAEMATRFGADLVLLQVVIPPTTTSVAMTEDLVRHARELADDKGYGTVVVGGTGGTKEAFPLVPGPQEFRTRVQEQLAVQT